MGQTGGIEVVGVEQTQRGLDRISDLGQKVPFVVNVATSDAKKRYESPYIARAVCAKIANRGLLNSCHTFGILGKGAIGLSITTLLREADEKYVHYDKDDAKAGSAKSIEELIDTCDVIIGTTGTDSLRGLFTDKLRGTKTVISASSSNIEFAYLFDLAKRYPTSFEDVDLAIRDDLHFIVLNGGYPINFDRVKEWERLEDIQLTRTLLYAGMIQALDMKRPHAGTICDLNHVWQQKIIDLWLALGGDHVRSGN